MSKPALSSRYAYRLSASSPNVGKLRSCQIVRVRNNGNCDLFVFGFPADGAPFTNGPVILTNISRDQGGTTPDRWCELPPQGENRQPKYPGHTDIEDP